MAFVMCGLLSGCMHTDKLIRTKSETELAVAAVNTEWLKPCEGLAGDTPDNEVGNLLQDYADLAAAYAACDARHKSLSDYLGPIVKKERGGAP